MNTQTAQTEYVLWGKKPDGIFEEILTNKPEQFKAAEAWAKKQGYTSFRIAKFEGFEFPNFAETINI